MVAAGQYALRILPTWNVSADMGSLINPNGTIAAYRAGGIIAPVSQDILTPYSYAYLTPGYQTPTPPAVHTTIKSFTPSPYDTATQPPTKTRTLLFIIPTATRTLTPLHTSTRTYTPTPTFTSTRTFTPTITDTPTQTHTPTFTSTFTYTFTPTDTSTYTPTFTPTDTSTPTPTFTPTDTDTPTWTFTPSDTPLPSDTPMPPTPTATLIQFPPPPYPNINFGPPDSVYDTIPTGSSATYTLPSPITAGHSGRDFVYYEHASGSGILMDFVTLQLSQDGSTWITVFAFGGGLYGNSNIATCPEVDNADVPIVCGVGTTLIGGTGVGIDIDSLGLTGSYPYLRIISPLNDSGDGCDVDAIEVYP